MPFKIHPNEPAPEERYIGSEQTQTKRSRSRGALNL